MNYNLFNFNFVFIYLLKEAIKSYIEEHSGSILRNKTKKEQKIDRK